MDIESGTEQEDTYVRDVATHMLELNVSISEMQRAVLDVFTRWSKDMLSLNYKGRAVQVLDERDALARKWGVRLSDSGASE